MKKGGIIFCLLAAFLCFFSKNVLAQVVINEFSSGTTNDWVEIYNTGSPLDISSLVLVDGDSNQKVFPSCTLSTNGTYAVDFSNRLNNGGDRIGLTKDSLLIDCVSYGTGPVCDGKAIDLSDLGENEFGVRQPEGSGTWVKETISTRSDNSACVSLTPTVTSSPTPEPTATSTPIPAPTPKAVYQINKAKDDDGNELSSADIYVDDFYIHHQYNETLTFCDGCHCDPDDIVDCNLGSHKILIKKEGYLDWSETRTLNAEDNITVSPVLNKIAPTLTPAPTATLTPTVTPTPTGRPTPTPTIVGGGEVLASSSGAIDENGPFSLNESESDLDLSNFEASKTAGTKNAGKNYLFPASAGILGLGFIGFSVFSFIKSKETKSIEDKTVV